MTSPRLREIIRQFPENGLKLLLHNAANVRDLLQIAGSELVDALDFSRMKIDPTSYVAGDFRHVESDLVVTIPFRRSRGRPRRPVILYVLIEHQSEPDSLMIFRVLDYMVQIWKGQVRAWGQRHNSLRGIRLQPILAVVFYSGSRRWESLGTLDDLIEQAGAFKTTTPKLEPLFVNLPALAAHELESHGGFLGWVLRLVQQRGAGSDVFQSLLQRVLDQLDEMPDEERLRWLELLSYIHALIYHVRPGEEHQDLQRLIEKTVSGEQDQQEVSEMKRTIADMFRDEGATQAKRDVLLRLLRRRFGKLPRATEEVIKRMEDTNRLDAWLDACVTVESLADMSIEPTE